MCCVVNTRHKTGSLLTLAHHWPVSPSSGSPCHGLSVSGKPHTAHFVNVAERKRAGGHSSVHHPETRFLWQGPIFTDTWAKPHNWGFALQAPPCLLGDTWRWYDTRLPRELVWQLLLHEATFLLSGAVVQQGSHFAVLSTTVKLQYSEYSSRC